jgi:hypothetical protein
MQTGTRQVWSHVLEVGVGIKPIYLTWSTYMSLRASPCIDFTLGCFHQPTRDLSEIEKDLEHSRGRAVDHREGNAHRVALDTDPCLSILGTTYIYINVNIYICVCVLYYSLSLEHPMVFTCDHCWPNKSPV